MLKKIRLSLRFSVSKYSTKTALDPKLREGFESQEFKPRKHPGRTEIKVVAIPDDIQDAIKLVLDNSDAKSYYEDSKKLNDYLHSRHLPPEQDEIDNKAAKILEKVSKRFYSKLKGESSQEEQETCDRKIQTSVFNILKKNVYNWGNIVYDIPTSRQYLMVRAAPEYAILVRVLDEIKRKHPDYQPRSFFDFGSGVGTGTWAVNHHWKNDVFEYFTVDSSSEMNDLARLILCKGRENVKLPFNAYFQRQFLPASADTKYNIVLSAFSLFEMPNFKSRIQTIHKLWLKTEDFLVIVEHGSNAGFQIINEARDFVLSLQRKSGYVFAPCVSDDVCPRTFEETKTPCNFIMKYESLPFPSKSQCRADLFSYVILRKGKRPLDDPQWPRIVRAPLVRSKHTRCELCTSQGKLERIIFSKGKYDQSTYRCARSSNWGDLLPVKLTE